MLRSLALRALDYDAAMLPTEIVEPWAARIDAAAMELMQDILDARPDELEPILDLIQLPTKHAG
eukprot:2489482-Prorocentrum_lima.AAC.1